MSEMVESRCCWPGCERLRPVLETDMRICWPHQRLVAEEYLRVIGHEADRDESAKARREASDGWVYYVRVGRLIKIGHTKVVYDRLRAYPPDATLLAVEPGTRQLEKERHSRFRAHLEHGREWFAEVDEVMDWVAKVRAANAAELDDLSTICRVGV